MSTSFNDYDFIERMADQFRASSSNFFGPMDRSVDVILLNNNTRVLNQEILKYRKIRIDIISNKPLTLSARIEFQTRYIPDSLKSEFRNKTFENVNELVTYVMEKIELRGTFPTRVSVINALGNIEPSSYNTFANQYPEVEQRISSGGPITSAEVAELIEKYRIDPNLFEENATDNIRNVLGIMQRSFSGMGLGLGLMGSFCSLMNNVYGTNAGVRDFLGTSASFSGDLSRVIDSISPRVSEMLSGVQSVASLVQNVRDASSSMQTSTQSAFQLIASAMDIIMTFFDKETGSPSKIEIEWDFVTIKEAIEAAIDDNEQEKSLFVLAKAIGDRSLADFNDDGVVDNDDLIILQEYIDEELEPGEIIEYIDQIMIPYMLENIENYKEYTKYSTSSENPEGVDISGVVQSLSSALNLFGSPSSPTSGDFGLSQLEVMINEIGSIENDIRNLVANLSNNVPVNIDSILSRIGNVRNSAENVSGSIFGDMRSTLNEFRNTTEEALTVAESVSVSDPTRTNQIQAARQQAVGENITRVLNISARATSEIVPILSQRLTNLETLLRSSAATGIINTIEQRLTSVVDQSAQQLRTVADTLSVTSLDNGFNFNMRSSFARFSALRARALVATEPGSVEHVQDVIRGNIANSTNGFRELNRESVEFIALRFCNMAGEIERMYNELIEPAQQMIDQSRTVTNQLEGPSNENSLRAIQAGAIRFPSSARLVAADMVSIVPATLTIDRSTGRSTPPPNGTLTDRERGPLPPLPAEFADLPRDRDVRGNVWKGLIRYNLGDRTIRRLRATRLPDNMGWDGIFYHGGRNDIGVDMLRRFILLVRAWQQSGGRVPLTVNSAYRPGDVTSSGRPSLHSRGIALDISMPPSDQRRFAALARSFGFGGTGFYSSFIHIDTGPTRQW
jgi:hypothetical protein